MQLSTYASAEIYFTEFFKVMPEVLEEYGTLKISLMLIMTFRCLLILSFSSTARRMGISAYMSR